MLYWEFTFRGDKEGMSDVTATDFS